MIVTPLIAPLLIWGAIALFGFFGVAGIAGVWKDPKKNKLGLLGMQKAGKTLFLSHLRNIPFLEGTSGRNSFNAFEHRLASGKKIIISAGFDIGGGKFYRSNYDGILDNADVVLYFFDINMYLKNDLDFDEIPYQRSCNSRFEHIYSKIKNNNKPVIIIATHKDKCNFPEEIMKEKFDKLVDDKSYSEILKEIEYVNLTNKNEIEKLVNKIFNEK